MPEASMEQAPAIVEIRPDRRAYNREHLIILVIAAVLMYAVLFLIGNPFPWTGIIGAIFAVFIRWAYVASEAMDMVWTLSDTHLSGPAERSIPLADIKTARRLFTAAQVATLSGDKYMIKYLADPQAIADTILSARDRNMA